MKNAKRTSFFEPTSSGKIVRPSADKNTDFHNEDVYPPWWTTAEVGLGFRELAVSPRWNCFMCALVASGLVWVMAELDNIYVDVLDSIYNISYAIHILAIGYRLLSELENANINFFVVAGFFIDIVTYSHYATKGLYHKLFCYLLRLHRPFKYIWFSNNFYHQGSLLGTTLTYLYICLICRIIIAWIWLHVKLIYHYIPFNDMKMSDTEEPGKSYLIAFYLINKLFIPIGASVLPTNNVEMALCTLIMLSGCLVVGGAVVATLALVVSLYMRPEESFRARYRLIRKDLEDNRIPEGMVTKVETYYNMYWEKQRAVSTTYLLQSFPPTLPASIYTDVYYEAAQKNRSLRYLSYQMLSEVSKKMSTIHYIPGDTIISRNTIKSHIIYIAYGDVEMLTAEDDSTALLRMTRGTVLTAASGAVEAAVAPAHVAVRAATFCTAHVLSTTHLWLALTKHSVTKDHAGLVLQAFNMHIEKVKRHYALKGPDDALYKSSILTFTRNLLHLKQRDDTGKLELTRPDVFLEVADCYILRNTTYSNESDSICLRSTFPYILQPNSTLTFAWRHFVAFLTLIVCFTHPYYMVFLLDAPLEFRFFDYFVTCIYILDLLIYLSTGTNIEEGVAISFLQTSSRQMRSISFAIDVMATVPLFEFWQEGHFQGINKLLRLPEVFQAIKDLETMYVNHSNIIRFMSYSLMLVLACFLTTSLQQAFMCFQSGHCQVTNFTHPPFWGKEPLDENSASSSLWFGLYWVISTITFTSHKEPWGTENTTHMLFTMAILEVSIIMRIFMESVYSATIMVTTALSEDYDSLMSKVKRFLVRNQIDEELRTRYMTYLQLCWYTDKGYKITHSETPSIYYDLPKRVYKDMIGQNHIKYLLSIPFMRTLKRDELKAVASTATIFVASPNEILLNTGDLSNEIYIIKKGTCELFSPSTKKAVCTLSSKNHFGSVICLLRLPAYYTIRAVTHVQILSVSGWTVNSALHDNVISLCANYMKNQPEFQHLTKRHPAFLTYTPPPPTPNRMFFRLPMKHQPDSEFLDPFTRLGVMSRLRYVVPRFTIRPDGRYLARYELVRVTCAVVSAMLFPTYTYLVLQWPWLRYLALLLDLSAWFDIFQRLLVGYFNEEGILVYHPVSTIAYYMKRAFIVDLMACLPLEHLVSERHVYVPNRYHRSPPVVQLLMMNRVLQLYRFPSGMHSLKDYFERRDVLMIIMMMPVYVSLLNVMVSLLIYCSVNIYHTMDRDRTVTGFLIVPMPDDGGSWIEVFKETYRFNATSSPWNLMVLSYYWVTYECTTVGYNSLRPSNLDQLKLLFFGMVCSAMILTYFSVRIISIRSNVNTALAEFQQYMREIDVFMKKEKVEEDLRKEIHRYYEYNWEKMGGINYRQMLMLCDQMTLRSDAIIHIYGHTFNQCSLLADADISLLRLLGRAIRSVYFLRGMKIIERDDVVHNIYFVDYGGVEARLSAGYLDFSKCIRLPRGSMFGNLSYTHAGRYPLNIVATDRLHLLMINTTAFYNIIADFPSVKELLEKYKKDNPFYILGNIHQAVVTLRKEKVEGGSQRSAKGFIKTIYFQDGLFQIYLVSVIMACIYLDIYNAGYQSNTWPLIYILYVLDLCFFVKIVMLVMMPMVVTNKTIKRILLPIRHIYFKKEFKYDILSCVPIELLCFVSDEHRWLIFSWLRLNRIFRIVTVYKCLQRHSERITVNLTVFTAIAGSIWFTLFVHSCTCTFHFIGHMIDRGTPKTSWMYNDAGECICCDRYICSLYFIITTFTSNGIGDILPKHREEMVFVVIMQILSTLIMMIYVGEFSKMMQHQSFSAFKFFSDFLEMHEYLKNNRVSANLVKIVNQYTLHLWRETGGLQVPKFLTDAHLSLRLRVMSHVYMHHITRHHIFEECEVGFLRQLTGCLRLFTYNQGMYVVKENEITNAMYIIHTGKVRETREGDSVSERIYPAGSYFGNAQGLIRDSPYTHSYRTMSQAQVLTLNLDDWEYLLHHFPVSKQAIYKHMPMVAGDLPHDRWPGAGAAGAPGARHAPYADEPQMDIDIDATLDSAEILEYINKSTTKEQRESDTTLNMEPLKRDPDKSADHSVPTKIEKKKLPKNKTKFLHFHKLKMSAINALNRLKDSNEKVSTTRTLSERKDELLEEEDEEATVTFLKQYDEAARRSRVFRLTSVSSKTITDKTVSQNIEEPKHISVESNEEENIPDIGRYQSELLSELSVVLSDHRQDIEDKTFSHQTKKKPAEHMKKAEQQEEDKKVMTKASLEKLIDLEEKKLTQINLERPSTSKNEGIRYEHSESLLTVQDLEKKPEPIARDKRTKSYDIKIRNNADEADTKHSLSTRGEQNKERLSGRVKFEGSTFSDEDLEQTPEPSSDKKDKKPDDPDKKNP